MKYYDILKYEQVFNGEPKRDVSVEKPIERKGVEVVDTSAIIKEMKSMFEEFEKNHSVIPPAVDDKNELNDDEVNEILGELLEFENAFGIALNNELSKKFIWNIPRNIYDLWKRVKADPSLEIVNPLIFLYVLCIKDSSPLIMYTFLDRFNKKLNRSGIFECEEDTTYFENEIEEDEELKEAERALNEIEEDEDDFEDPDYDDGCDPDSYQYFDCDDEDDDCDEDEEYNM